MTGRARGGLGAAQPPVTIPEENAAVELAAGAPEEERAGAGAGPAVQRWLLDAGGDLRRSLFVAAAVLLPVLLLVAHRDLGHRGDLAFFHEWYLAFRESAAFYRDGPGLNYPILGVLLVAGPATVAEALAGDPLTLDAYQLLHKCFLAAAEMLAIVLAAGLARELRIRRPRLAALGIALLPSSWALGAWFGQIDVWGSVFLLAAALFLFRYRRTGRAAALAPGLLLFHAAVLTKQLTWFTLPALAIPLVLALRAHGRRAHIGVALLSPALWFVADPFLELPDGYVSHLHWVIAGGGSDQGFIVAGGASLWSLLSDSSVRAADWHFFGLDAVAWGALLYGAAQALLVVQLARARAAPAALALYAGISNLAMATLLTNVHERYLVHAVPFLLLALLAAGRRLELAATAVVSAWWGLFVLGTIHPSLATPHEPVALLSLGLLGWLAATRPSP